MKARYDMKEAEREKFDQLQKMKDQDDKKKRQRELKEKQAKQAQENKAMADAQRKLEEEEQMNKLEGRMQNMLNYLQENETPFEYTLSGMELGSARCRMLATNIAYNKSLFTLHLVRKGILDHDGISLAYMLRTNKVLRKLELEGNNLGPLCAFAFGRVLMENTSLQYLDLESNQLTNDGCDFKGVLEMLNFLETNTTLTSLNLANNMLNEDCGSKLAKMLEHNFTLIDLDYTMNKFYIDDSRAI